MSDDDGIPDEFSHSIPHILPSFPTFEHLLSNPSDQNNLFFERYSRIDEHRPFFFIDDSIGRSDFFDLESDRCDFYDRIIHSIESGSFEIESDECVPWRIQNAKLKIQSV